MQNNFYITVSGEDEEPETSLITYYKRYGGGIGRLWVIDPPYSYPGITKYLFTLAIIDEINFKIKYLPTVDTHRDDCWETLRYCDELNDFSEIEDSSIEYGLSPNWQQIDKMVFDKLQPDILVKYIVARVCKEIKKLTHTLNTWEKYLELNVDRR